MLILKARLNHGRWIADCPNCNSADFAVPGEDFACLVEALGRAREEFRAVGRDTFSNTREELLARAVEIRALLPHYPVEFPKNKAAIDAAVAGRPVENQNWEPGETLAFLARENEAHGVGV